MHAAKHDGSLDLAQDVLGIDPRGRALGKAGQDAHLLLATFLSLGNLPLGLNKRVVQERIRTREHRGHGNIQSAAPPPMVLGLAGHSAVPHGDGGRYATQPEVHSGRGRLSETERLRLKRSRIGIGSR